MSKVAVRFKSRQATELAMRTQGSSWFHARRNVERSAAFPSRCPRGCSILVNITVHGDQKGRFKNKSRPHCSLSLTKSPLKSVLGVVKELPSCRKVYLQRHRGLLSVKFSIRLDPSSGVHISMRLGLVAYLHECQVVVSPNCNNSFCNFVSHILKGTSRHT